MPPAAAGPPAPAGGDYRPEGSGPVILTPASLTRRIAALAYEGLLLCAVLFGTGFLLAPWVSPGTGASALGHIPLPATPARLAIFATLFGVAALYFSWSWSGGRRTLPMKTWRLRLVRCDGTPVDRGSAVIRYAAAWVGPTLALLAYVALKPAGAARYALWLTGLNYAWAWLDRDRAFLHDRIAGTRIVRDAD